MSKSKAIKLKCLDCSGGSHKDVKLCQIFDCPLWSFRLGYSTTSPRYMRTMDEVKRNHAAELQELVQEGTDISCFFEAPNNKIADSAPEDQEVDENATLPPTPQAHTNIIKRFPKKENMSQGDDDELPPLLKLMRDRAK